MILVEELILDNQLLRVTGVKRQVNWLIHWQVSSKQVDLIKTHSVIIEICSMEIETHGKIWWRSFLRVRSKKMRSKRKKMEIGPKINTIALNLTPLTQLKMLILNLMSKKRISSSIS